MVVTASGSACFDECMVRLMTTNGIMLLTFTPLLGLSEIALRFLPELAPNDESEGRRLQ